jgi:hypothetical protein
MTTVFHPIGGMVAALLRRGMVPDDKGHFNLN